MTPPTAARRRSRLGDQHERARPEVTAPYAKRVTGNIAALIALAIPALVAFLVAFLVIYYAVRLAIRHERERERRRTPPVE